MARKRKIPSENVPCQYDCGRKAEGSLMVSYTTWDDDELSYRHGFSATIPCCRQCMKKALTLQVTIPKVEDRP